MPREYEFAPFRLDTVNQCLWRGAEQISLSPKAYSVLLYLADRQGRLVTKRELLDAVWPDTFVTEGVLKRAVLEARKALDDSAEEPRFIQTMHRRGYRFLADSAASEPTPRSAPVEPEIVGRAQELHQLDLWFEGVVESSRKIVFICGEAGLGKTALVDAWMRSLSQRKLASKAGGVAVARGRCLQQFGSGEPYLPVFEVLAQLAQCLGTRLVECLRSRAPTWLLHMPALISLEDRVKLRDEVFGSTRERMLREIADALETLSGQIPLVLVLEDLQWSDPSTVDLLTWIGNRTTPARLMILATYRPSDAGGDSAPLRVAQNELSLHRLCQVMPLAYLTEEETHEYIAKRFRELDSPGISAKLHRRTDGNPLYVVCLVDELERSGQIDKDPQSIQNMVPEPLQQMFERQAARLDNHVQEMLDVAAAAGENFSAAGVAVALGKDVTEVEAQCEKLVRHNLILKPGESFRYPDGSESAGYSFLHALCRDALYRRMPSGRRARLHGLLAVANEKLYESDPKRVAAELAGHFELSGNVARTIRYLRIAADGAASRQSNQEAMHYLERALTLSDLLQGADRLQTRLDILEHRGVLRMSFWDLQGAVTDLNEVAETARLAGAADRQGKALLETVSPWSILAPRQALAAIEKGRSALLRDTDPTAAAMIDLHRHFANILLSGWNQQDADTFNSILPKVAAIDDPRIRSRISVMEAAILCFSEKYSGACEKAEKARKESRKAGAFFEYFTATLFLHWAHIHRGDLGHAIRVAKEDADLAARNGSTIPRLWLTVRTRWVEMEAFDFQQALATYEQYAAAPDYLSQRHNFPMLLWLGQARLGAGDTDGAWEALERLHASMNDGGFPFQVVCPLCYVRAECALARKDTSGARVLAVSLIQIANEHHQFSYAARGWRLLAEVALLEKDRAAALAHLAQARAAVEKCEAWTVEWRVYANAARILAQLKRYDESAAARERSLCAANRVADTLVDEPGLRQSFLKRVARDLPARRKTVV